MSGANFIDKIANIFRRDETSQQGKPVQILRKSEKTKLLELDHDELNSVLCHPTVGNKLIALISIVGAYRTGKSFLLNFILRYLENKGYENPSWIGEDDKKLEGFDWSGGDDPQTIGIWMWSKPFIVKKDGKEVAVFLVDTQGHFDLDDNKQQCQIAVMMSMLLSSVTVYNVGKRVQKPDLEFLELCIEYSERTNHGQQMCPLQALTFLIRDWMDEENCPYGEEGGKKYLEKRIPFYKESTVEGSLSRMLHKLHSNFDSVKCYLMPPPGHDVERRKFRGKLADIPNRDEFTERLKEFCDRVAKPSNLILKNDLTGHSLMNLLIRNFAAMKENEIGLLAATSYEQIKQDNEASEAFHASAGEIEKKMNEALKNGYLSSEEFMKRYKEIWNETRGKFRKEIGFLGEAGVERQEERLKKYVDFRHFKRCDMANKITKLVHGDIVEDALRLVKVYKKEMKDAMKHVPAQEWDLKLNSRHKEILEMATKAFREYSTKPEYEQGLEILNAGILCAKGFMKLDGSLRQDAADYEWKKLICECIEEYTKVILKGKADFKNAGKNASIKTLEYFDIQSCNKFGAARDCLKKWLDSLQTQEGAATDRLSEGNKLAEVIADVELFEFKRKVFEEIKTYSEQIQVVFYGKKLEKVMKNKKSHYSEEASKLERSLGKTEARFTQEVVEMVEIALNLLKTRDKSLEPFRDRTLQLDLKIRKLQYLTTIGESLDDAYILPDVLEELHSKTLKGLLPDVDKDDPILCKHRDNVKKALDQTMEEFKTWNEENKSTFKRVVGKVAGGLGFASAGAAGGTAAGLFIADIAIVTTVGAAVATGVGAAIVAGVLIAGGAASAFTLLRKKACNENIQEQIKRTQEGQLPELDEEDQNERNQETERLLEENNDSTNNL